MEDRLKQTITIMKKLTGDLGLPLEAPEIQAIKARMTEFVRTGEPWSGKLSLAPWDREAVLEMSVGGKIELTLRSLMTGRKRKGRQ